MQVTRERGYRTLVLLDNVHITFNVSTLEIMSVIVFTVTMLCGDVCGYIHFGGKLVTTYKSTISFFTATRASDLRYSGNIFKSS
jgi:hypothetical protein